MNKVFVSAMIHRVRRTVPWKHGPVEGWQLQIVTVEDTERTDGSIYHLDNDETIWYEDYPKLLEFLQATLAECNNRRKEQ